MNAKTVSVGELGSADSESCEHGRVKLAVSVAMAVWFAVVLMLGAQGAFVRAAGAPPTGILLGAVTPLAVFFGAYFGWSAFRAFVLGADLRLGAAIQGWRVGGLGFLALYAHGILPGLFAFPAGLGDIAVGVTAPWMVMKLMDRPGFAGSRRYVTWNILGIVDLVVALTMGGLCSGVLPGLTGKVTTTPMTELPLVLIPAYLVPFFVMLHFTALAQARRVGRGARQG